MPTLPFGFMGEGSQPGGIGPADQVEVLAVTTYHSSTDATSLITATHTITANTDCVVVVAQPVVANNLGQTFSSCTFNGDALTTAVNFQDTTDHEDMANCWIGYRVGPDASGMFVFAVTGADWTGIGFTVYDLRFVDQTAPLGATASDLDQINVATWPSGAALTLNTTRDKSLVIGGGGSDRRSGASNPIGLHSDSTVGWVERVDAAVGGLSSEPAIWNGSLPVAVGGQIALRLTPSASNGFGMGMAEFKGAV